MFKTETDAVTISPGIIQTADACVYTIKLCFTINYCIYSVCHYSVAIKITTLSEQFQNIIEKS